MDLYQTGFLTIGEEIYDAAVWDKEEAKIHIALLDTTKVVEVYFEADRPVVVVEYTDKLNKQLREHPRWRVSVPARLYLFREKINPRAVLLLVDVSDVEEIDRWVAFLLSRW